MENTVEIQIQHVSANIEIVAEFAIAFGLQIIGALVILFIGLKFAGFMGRRITNMCTRKELDITLSRFAGNAAKTLLIGEDQERITIPNRKVVGEILVNSDTHRIVESQIVIAADSDLEAAIAAISAALDGLPNLADGGEPQVGIQDFSYGAIVLGLRYWVPSSRYLQSRFEVSRAAYAALKGAGIKLISGRRVAVLAESPTAGV